MTPFYRTWHFAADNTLIETKETDFLAAHEGISKLGSYASLWFDPAFSKHEGIPVFTFIIADNLFRIACLAISEQGVPLSLRVHHDTTSKEFQNPAQIAAGIQAMQSCLEDFRRNGRFDGAAASERIFTAAHSACFEEPRLAA